MVLLTGANMTPIRRGEKSYPYCGRLIVVENVNTYLSSDTDKAFSIDFPAMPEQIELARRTEYVTSVNMVMPDGIHQYMSTSLLKIPFSFKIHHSDSEYCAEGPLTLLKVAARFHSLVIPLGDHTQGVQVTNDAPIVEGGSNPGAQRVGSDAPKDARTTNSKLPTYESSNRVDPPVTVRLQLISTSSTGPGIYCVGYVEDVKVVLYGPWLRGPNESQNLPSAAEYSFTFVHRPGHGNFATSKKAGAPNNQLQAYAQFVRERLYNTVDLTEASSVRTRGWTNPGKDD
jgi:hypothetical protein